MRLLAWWFVFLSYYAATTVGPFRDQNECENMRGWLLASRPSLNTQVSWCWWDGKP